MHPQDRYFVAKTQMAERIAEAQRARMVRGEPSADDAGASVAADFRETVRRGLVDRLHAVRAWRSAHRHATA